MYLVVTLNKVGLVIVNHYKTEIANAFIFSFINQHNTKVVMKCKIPSNAIITYSEYGPTFGIDLHMCNNSNTRDQSYTNLQAS